MTNSYIYKYYNSRSKASNFVPVDFWKEFMRPDDESLYDFKMIDEAFRYMVEICYSNNMYDNLIMPIMFRVSKEVRTNPKPIINYIIRKLPTMLEEYRIKYLGLKEDYESLCCQDLANKCIKLREEKLKRILQ